MGTNRLMLQNSTLTMHGKKHTILPFSIFNLFYMQQFFYLKFDRVFILVELEIPFYLKFKYNFTNFLWEMKFNIITSGKT